MKERAITLLGAAIAFYLVYVLLFPHPAPFQKQLSLPTTEDRGKYGLMALKTWLDNNGIATLALRDRYHALYDNPELPAQGNLLISSLPHRLEMRQWESEQLTTWLSQGNSILLLTAMSDWPEWAQRHRSNSVNQMLSLLGVRMYQQSSDDSSEQEDNQEQQSKPSLKEVIENQLSPKETPRPLVSAGQHAVTHSIKQVDVTWLESEGLNWHLAPRRGKRSALIVLHDQQTLTPALWQIRVGQGIAWVTRHADMFANKSLGNADNARLVANIIDYSVNHDGVVIFDDTHQGLTAMYDPEAFFDDSRLHHTLWFILALWLIYLLGHTNRIQSVYKRLTPQLLVEHVKAFGGLFARRLHSSAVAQRMFLYFFNDIRAVYGLPRNGKPVWDVLRENPNVNSQSLERVKHLHQRTENNYRVNLTKLSRYINEIRKQLL